MPKRKREINTIDTTQLKENFVNNFSNSFSDITFKFNNGKVLKYHKIILYKDSIYFRDLFDTNKDIKEIDTTDIKYLSDYELMLDYFIIIEKNIEDIPNDIVIDYVKLFELHEYINSLYINDIISNIHNIKLNDKMNVYISILNNYCMKDKFMNKIAIIKKLIKNISIKFNKYDNKHMIEYICKLNEMALYLLFTNISYKYSLNRIIINQIFKIVNNMDDIIDIEKTIKLIGENKVNILLYINYKNDIFNMTKVYKYIDITYIHNLIPFEKNLINVHTFIEKNKKINELNDLDNNEDNNSDNDISRLKMMN